MAKIDIKKTELVWLGKYDEDGKLVPVEKPGPYPFQIVEVINNPRTGKENPQPGLFETWKGDEGDTFEEGWKNKLIWGDNKLIMSSLLEKFAGKINLIYIDPPFATGADFKFKIQVGDEDEEIIKEHSVIEEKAYRDTWGRGLDSYLQMMYERLVLMKELLVESGSIYVHLDQSVGHYVKLILDEIFGFENFLGEIVWYRYNKIPDKTKKLFFKMHDTIFHYAKNKGSHVFNSILSPTGKMIKRKKMKKINGKMAVLDEYTEYERELLLTRSVIEFIPDPNIGDSSEKTGFDTQKAEGLIYLFILASSNPGDLVADFFCGSGTTLAVAEKLGRRWIGCDLSRYAIHVTRKKLLEIQNSKDLENEDKKYGRKARPFEILNLGKYERQLWQVKTFSNKDEKQALYEYLAFILKLYGAEPISGLSHVNGRKGSALIYVGAVDMPVTINDCIEAINDCKSLGQKELHVLGWEWEMGLNDAIQEIASKEGIKLKLRLIPMDVLDQEAVKRGDIQFFELAHFKAEIKQDSRKVLVELKDFVIPHTDLIPEDVKDKIKKWTDWIDYWAIDFDYRNDTFNNGWTSYRTKKDRKLSLKAEHKYEKPGKYKLFIKVIDIFGIDSSKIYEIEVK